MGFRPTSSCLRRLLFAHVILWVPVLKLLALSTSCWRSVKSKELAAYPTQVWTEELSESHHSNFTFQVIFAPS